jgi:hypothetical protein
MKTVAAACLLSIAATVAAPATAADARMLSSGGMMGGFGRPMVQPMGPMRHGLTVVPRARGFWPTVGNFEVKRPPPAQGYDYPGYYAGRFDGIGNGGTARGVGSNETITVHGGRTETTGGSGALFNGGFRGGVGAASSGKSSSYIRMFQPHTGSSSSRHVRHRGFSIVDRTNLNRWP